MSRSTALTRIVPLLIIAAALPALVRPSPGRAAKAGALANKHQRDDLMAYMDGKPFIVSIKPTDASGSYPDDDLHELIAAELRAKIGNTWRCERWECFDAKPHNVQSNKKRSLTLRFTAKKVTAASQACPENDLDDLLKDLDEETRNRLKVFVSVGTGVLIVTVADQPAIPIPVQAVPVDPCAGCP